MKEEVRRIMDLVKDGKLSPEDAADLIDAFVSTDSGPSEPQPPEPPTGSAEESGDGPKDGKDPFKSFVDFVENIGKEVSDGVNWKDVATHMRKAAERGLDGIRSGVDQIKQGKVNFNWLSSAEIREVTLPLNISTGTTLRVENPCGDVKISGGHTSASVSAKATVRGSSTEEAKEKADAYTLIVEESDYQVIVRQPDVSGLSVDLVIQLKDEATVEVRTQNGEVRLLDTMGGCRVVSQSGDIHVRGLRGPIEVTTQNGDIRLEDCESPSGLVETKHGDVTLLRAKGNFNARTASGDIRGRECSGSTYSVESVSGDVSIDFFEPVRGTVNVRTVNGNSEVFVDAASDCRVSVSTLRGNVDSDLSLADEVKSEQRVTGRLGDGNGVLDLSGVNGDVALRMRDSKVTDGQSQ